ncbi:MAG: NERD domain-containing protein [Spirochaetales bacterium]|nr:NERD domain-containing protein [Spirochaetales bacterium]
MGYLICDNCHGYYELEEGESPEDFSSKCECGGNLKYKSSISSNHETESEGRDKVAYGYSHTDEKSFNYKIVMIFGIVIIFVGIIGIITFNIIGLILAVAGFIIFYKGYNEGYSWIKGDKGEKIVSLYLEDLPSGYFVFNDVNIPNGKGNIDHLVIGPTGIFLIETKNYSGFFKIDGDNWSIGNSNRKLKKNPGTQVKLNALDLSKFLNKKLGKKFWVYGVVTLLNNNFKLIKKPNRYYVVGAGNLTKFILKFQNKIDKKTVNNIFNLIQDYSTEIYYKKEDVELE